MARIQILSDDIINQIAAGEIIERPASVIKELVENSIDAGSTKIEIFLQNAGRTKLVVEDNGNGISYDDLPLSVMRHATSKLTGTNLFDINSYGFRGEALPSIASISQFCIESEGNALYIDFGGEPSITTSLISTGTRVSVQNMFDRIPARLKFLKSDNIELSHCLELVENFAITHPAINLTVRNETKTLLSFTENNQKTRIAEVIGNEQLSRSMYLEESDDVLSIRGYFCHPVDSKYSQASSGSKSSQRSQRIFINDRWVKDRTVSSAIKAAFKDLLPAGRTASCIVFVQINPFYLDINVSPTKSEIRFRDTNYVHKFITQAIRKNLPQFDKISISADNDKLLNTDFRVPNCQDTNQDTNYSDTAGKIYYINQFINPKSKDDDHYEFNDIGTVSNYYVDSNTNLPRNPVTNEESNTNTDSDIPQDNIYYKLVDTTGHIDVKREEINNPTIGDQSSDIKGKFLGEPIGQVLDTYIICKAHDGLVIIDQHAVHEKITMKKILNEIDVKNSQHLVRPEILELDKNQVLIANEILPQLSECGFIIEITENVMLVSAIPTVMQTDNVPRFLYDLLEDSTVINELEVIDTVRLKIANIACHNSIRSGRKLTIDEMTSIIREMEKTESIHQCNHHRPCFMKITKHQLERMFERR